MQVSLLVAERGYSFANQADALAKGLLATGASYHIVKISNGMVDVSELQKGKPDVVISVGDWHDFELLVDTPRQVGLTVVPWVVADTPAGDWAQRYNELPLVLVTGQHIKEVLSEVGVAPEKIAVLREAVDDEVWRRWDDQQLSQFLKMISVEHPSLPLPDRSNLVRAKQQGVPILFTTGGSGTAKGAQEVLSALARVDKSLPWVYIIKAWPSKDSFGYCADELALAERLGVAERVRYVVGEFSSEFMVGLMNVCDLYVSPLRQLGLGLPLVEAQMCEKPVIAMAATATEETVRHGETGFLSKRDEKVQDIRADIDDLSQYLHVLISDAGKRREMGFKAGAYARETFQPVAVAGQLLNVLRQFGIPAGS